MNAVIAGVLVIWFVSALLFVLALCAAAAEPEEAEVAGRVWTGKTGKDPHKHWAKCMFRTGNVPVRIEKGPVRKT